MAKVVEEVELDGGKGLAFFCPGCKYYHSFRVELGDNLDKPVWRWNGSMDRPTFSPSLLVNGQTEQRCHSFVNDGHIQFLSDCWHDLRSQTVEMQDSGTWE